MHHAADILKFILLEQDEVQEHLDEMSKSTLYDVSGLSPMPVW
jgi:hypothetical protein